MAGGSGKSYCPTCGAAAGNEKIGRDGSPRWMDSKYTPLSDDPALVKKRKKANRIRQRNLRGGKK